MNSSSAYDYRNLGVVRKLGMEALKKELGVVGAAYFMRQYCPGYGNYTEDRKQLLAGITLSKIDEIIGSLEPENERSPHI
ncbi:MAG: hypothetical protein FWE76_06825 [Symbiobacteriaceae bacterium]|nr:hypothetical protein [Symbiobacteriaceae bacterium]